MLLDIVNTVELVVLALLAFFLFYLLLLSVLSLFAPRYRFQGAIPKQRFAFVVPAHNEETCIEKTLRSLFAVDYPGHLFEVIVVADNCSDRTAQKASSCGATVFERVDKTLRGKGYALHWCIDRLERQKSNFDAIVVVDADSVVSPNFLAVMNAYLCNGEKVIQAADLVEPQAVSWNSEVTRIALILYNYARPLGRKCIGCSAGLRGNGMCFSAATLREVRWSAYSITEDLEYGLELVLHGVSVAFAPEATVLATMPQQERNAISQRARWETGRLPVMRKYAGRLLWHAVKNRSYVALDSLVELLTPAFVNMMILIIAVMVFKILVWSLGWDPAGESLDLWFIVFCAGGMYVFIGLSAASASAMMTKVILFFPKYVGWKMKIYRKLLSTGFSKEWIRTTREL
ncbi:MAG: glycosyltransferase [Ignavibacteriales bacterium]|nr:glycosyltransferase [Ignavibacteriales bacterium]